MSTLALQCDAGQVDQSDMCDKQLFETPPTKWLLQGGWLPDYAAYI